MLTWDEEVTSALAHTAYAGLQQHRVVDTPPSTSATAAQTDRIAASLMGPAHAATESRASGTQHISSKTDVNQWSEEKYPAAGTHHGMPQEIRMPRGIVPWKNPLGLDEGEIFNACHEAPSTHDKDTFLAQLKNPRVLVGLMEMPFFFDPDPRPELAGPDDRRCRAVSGGARSWD